jgi:hypothetical protein
VTNTQLLDHGSSSFTSTGRTAGKYEFLGRVADTPADYAVVAYCRVGTNLIETSFREAMSDGIQRVLSETKQGGGLEQVLGKRPSSLTIRN